MKSAVLVFANHPLPVLVTGAVPDTLALALLKDTLRNLADVDADVFLFLDPGQDKDEARTRLGPGTFKIANALGRNFAVQQRNAFRLAFSRQYQRVLLLDNAAPDLPAHAVQSALDGLGWKGACMGPVAGPDGEPEDLYALGFEAEGWMTESFDHVDRDRPGLFRRLETLLLFYERKVRVLPPYAPVRTLADCAALEARCRDTRFARLPSLRLAAEHSAAPR